jgi:hypothetical protein
MSAKAQKIAIPGIPIGPYSGEFICVSIRIWDAVSMDLKNAA